MPKTPAALTAQSTPLKKKRKSTKKQVTSDPTHSCTSGPLPRSRTSSRSGGARPERNGSSRTVPCRAPRANREGRQRRPYHATQRETRGVQLRGR